MYGYPGPTIIRSELYATVPEEYQQPGSGPRSPLRDSKTGSTLEGPSFDRQGNLYITDVPNGRVFRISPAREVTLVARYEGEPNGLKIHKDGRIFVADHHHGIMLLDRDSGRVTPFVAGPEKERFKGVNDLVFASNGDLYFTDQGATGLRDPTGRIYRMEPDKRLTLLLDTVPSPNGIVLDRSETVVFVAATRSSEVWSVPMSPTGGRLRWQSRGRPASEEGFQHRRLGTGKTAPGEANPAEV